jgi:hypothetical protein
LKPLREHTSESPSSGIDRLLTFSNALGFIDRDAAI